MVVEDFRELWQGMAEHSSTFCGRGHVAESLHTTADREASGNRLTVNLHGPNTKTLFLLRI